MTEPRVLPPDDLHNRLLMDNVHPADWVNPTPASMYNVVVLGAGSAGLVTTAGAALLGAKAAIVERDLMGGDCLNVGCVPSKCLIRSARAFADVRDAGALGIRVPDGVTVDFPAVMERLRRLRASMSPNDSAQRFRSLGAHVFLGSGRFVSPEAIEVAGQILRFRRAVIATGARARRPDIPGLEASGFLTNETVFQLTTLPRRLAVLGAGPLGCELAQSFARFGAQVVVFDTAPRIMPREDADAAEVVRKEMTRDGVRFVLGARVTQVARSAGERVLTYEVGGVRAEERCDELLVGIGRTPNVDGLGLESAGVAFDTDRGVHVDDRLRTSNPRVFAAGDVCSRFQFTHAADALARIAVQNSLFFGRAKASALTIPWCTYTDPEVAHVGLNEAEAAARGVPHRTLMQPLAEVDRAIVDGETAGFVKLLIAPRGDRILGATIVARHAGEMISEVTLAMIHGLGLNAIGRTIHPYPTQAEALRKAAAQASRGRLTPWVVGWLRRYFAWGR